MSHKMATFGKIFTNYQHVFPVYRTASTYNINSLTTMCKTDTLHTEYSHLRISCRQNTVILGYLAYRIQSY